MPLSRFRLLTFGRLALIDPSGAEHDLTKRRRQLAVLAYLALADRPVSRESLAAMFWGEQADERARHSLSNTLSSLRAAIGRSAIDLGRHEVSLATDAPLDVDAREVARAAAARDWAGVLLRVGGPFLDGVFVEGSNRFEDWLSAERRKMERWVEQAAASEAPRLLAAADWAAAARVADAWLAAAPFDADAILARLQAEAADGSSEAIRRALALHERILRRLEPEFGRRLDPRITAFPVTLAMPVAAAADATPPAPNPSASSPAVRAAAPRARRRLALALGALVTLVAGSAALALSRPARPAWVLVADLEHEGRDSVYDGSITVALGTSLSLSRTTQVVSRSRLHDMLLQMRVADSLGRVSERIALDAATRMGADAVLVPSLARVGDRLMLGGRLLQVPSGRVLATERAEAPDESGVLAAVDRLARRVRRRLGESVLAAREGVPLPDATTASLPALKAFATGLEARERDRHREAQTAFRAAIAFDSAFAQPYVALGTSLAMAGESDSAERLLAKGLALAERLPPREAMLLRREAAAARRNWATAIDIGARWLAAHPRDREALHAQAYALFRAGRTAEALEAHRSLLAVDSLDADAWLNFASALPFTPETTPEKLAAYGHAMQLEPAIATGITVNHEIGGALARAGRPDSARAIFARMLALDAAHRARGYRSLGYLAMWRGRYAEAAAAFAEAITWQRASGEVVGEVRARLARARALRGLGRTAEEMTELDSALAATRRHRFDPVVAAWVGKELARSGRLRGVREVAALVKARVAPGRPSDHAAALLVEAELATASGDAGAGLARLDSLVRLDSSAIVRESQAHAAFAAGRLERAAQLYAGLAATEEFGWEGSEGTRLAPYWAARVAEALGDTLGARGGYRAFVAKWDDPDAGLLVVVDAATRARALAGSSR